MRSFTLKRHFVEFTADRSFAVDRLTERIDDTSDDLVTDTDGSDTTGTFYGVSFLDLVGVVHEDNADAVLVEVEDDSHGVANLDELIALDVGETESRGDTIADGAFVGDGCAISQASTDIMLGMIVGKSREEALRLGDLFLRMIRGEASEEEIDSLEEASALRDVSHMPARVKCAMLGWRTLREALGEKTPS